MTASMIDASTIRLQSGAADLLAGHHLQPPEASERVELTRAYRSPRKVR